MARLCDLGGCGVQDTELLLGLCCDKGRAFHSCPGSGHSHHRTLGGGQRTGDGLRDKHTEFTAGKFQEHAQLHFKSKRELGHSHLPGRAGPNQDGGGGWEAWGGQGRSSPLRCPQSITSQGPLRPFQLVHISGCLVGSQTGVPLSSSGHSGCSHAPPQRPHRRPFALPTQHSEQWS